MSLAYSFFVESAEQARAEVRAAEGLARLVELRLDTAPGLDFEALVRDLGVPVIATCPLESDGGRFGGTAEERDARLLAAARGGARFVDVALGQERPEGLPERTHVVHSWHEQPGEQADLRLQLHRIEGRLDPGDVAKVVAWADTHAEAMRVRALFDTTRAPLVAFAQGPGSRASRAWAPVFGSPWTYVCGEGDATAPGQWTLRELVALYPPGGASPATTIFGVVGRPIAHSRSPLLWNTALRMAALDAFYVAVEVESFDGFLHAHHHKAIQGFSVTAPFKRAALEAATLVDDTARAVGAANTLHRGPGGWKAYATDGPAALDVLEEAGASNVHALLVLGAGGAARAAVHEGRRRGYSVHVAARRLESAQALAADLDAEALPLDAVDPTGFGAIVQATPVGSEATPGNLLAGRRLAADTRVLDMVYAPARTALLAQVAEQGAVPVPGYRMLVAQMQAQFRIFTGQDALAAPLLRTVEADLEREAGRASP